jgi:hypothetical protein
MAGQNILRFYGKKIDIKVDVSSVFDREQEKTEKYDLKIDNSEIYDYELDYIPDYELFRPDIPVTHKMIFGINLSTDDYYLTDADGIILMTEGYNELQFVF